MHKSSYLLHYDQIFLPHHYGRNFAPKDQVEFADLQQYSQDESQLAHRGGHCPGVCARFELIEVIFLLQCMNGILVLTHVYVDPLRPKSEPTKWPSTYAQVIRKEKNWL